MNLYDSFVRPALFRIDPERVHHLTLAACGSIGRSPIARRLVSAAFETPPDPRLETTVAGIRFPNPLGLGAGYDKNGEGVDVLSRLGFGFIDVGSVSRQPSDGNPVRPRLHRLALDEALMVNYGVPNHGAVRVAARLAQRRSAVPVGVTIVETNTGRVNDPDDVVSEMAEAAAAFTGVADLLLISTACANVNLGPHPYDDLDNLRRLLERLARIDGVPPTFIKIHAAGDDAIERILALAEPFPFVAGFKPSVVPVRPFGELRTPAAVLDRLAGTPTSPVLQKPMMLDGLRQWHRLVRNSRYALMAAGGVRTGEDAYEAIRAGASLVALVTALVYRGPGLARRINRELSALLERDGFDNVTAAVGA